MTGRVIVFNSAPSTKKKLRPSGGNGTGQVITLPPRPAATPKGTALQHYGPPKST